MTCDKVQYDNYQLAMQAAHGLSRNDKSNMKAYKCNDCGKYHLATQGKKKIIPNVYENSKQIEFKKGKSLQMNPIPKQSRPTSFIHSTQKLLTKEQADNLKRLINGQNEIDKQKKVL